VCGDLGITDGPSFRCVCYGCLNLSGMRSGSVAGAHNLLNYMNGTVHSLMIMMLIDT
jgi:hypothetical protein